MSGFTHAHLCSMSHGMIYWPAASGLIPASFLLDWDFLTVCDIILDIRSIYPTNQSRPKYRAPPLPEYIFVRVGHVGKPGEAGQSREDQIIVSVYAYISSHRLLPASSEHSQYADKWWYRAACRPAMARAKSFTALKDQRPHSAFAMPVLYIPKLRDAPLFPRFVDEDIRYLT